MIVIRDDLWLCVDCLMFACNGDTSGVTDYPNEPDKRIKEVIDGVTALGEHLVPDFDSETEEGIRDFSSCGCDACGSGLAGTMHRFAVLGHKEPPLRVGDEIESYD